MRNQPNDYAANVKSEHYKLHALKTNCNDAFSRHNYCYWDTAVFLIHGH